MQKYGCRLVLKGRPKKRWNEVVKDDLKKYGIYRGLAKNRER